jgi:hypothetical protein
MPARNTEAMSPSPKRRRTGSGDDTSKADQLTTGETGQEGALQIIFESPHVTPANPQEVTGIDREVALEHQRHSARRD